MRTCKLPAQLRCTGMPLSKHATGSCRNGRARMSEASVPLLQVNPMYIARNHVMQEAIGAAEDGDFSQVTLSVSGQVSAIVPA